MRQDGFSYIVRAEVIFTPEEVALLIQLSQAHYDRTCRRLSEDRGLLVGLKNVFTEDDDEPVPWSLAGRELDLLCKVLEGVNYLDGEQRQAGVQLRAKMVIVLDRVGNEYKQRQGTSDLEGRFKGEVTPKDAFLDLVATATPEELAKAGCV